jgi:hypothetical protein
LIGKYRKCLIHDAFSSRNGYNFAYKKNIQAPRGLGAIVVNKVDSKSEFNGASTSASNASELAKLGFAERTHPRREKPGRVGFDDLGNAQFQWDQTLLGEGAEQDTRRERALTIANLVLVDDEPPPDARSIGVNKKGLRLGYNPYDSGRLEKQQWKKPRDLRALSKWIESQKKLGQNTEQEEDE